MQKLGSKVIYQIYPKSFFDSNGDGIGDLRGIIQKIDYIKQLNVDMIWFNPFFVSPQKDNGYDIADYKRIDPRFGTMADFEELVAKLKEINVGVMLDMVLNHCSTEHEWFQKALAGDKKYQKFFYLRKSEALIQDGMIKGLLKDDPQIFAYERTLNGQRLLVLCNFYAKSRQLDLPASWVGQTGRVLLANDACAWTEVPAHAEIAPYEAICFKAE